MFTFRWISTKQLAAFGARVFAFRLLVGLAAAAIGIKLLVPTPPFAEGYRLLHTSGLVLVVLGLGLRAWGAASAGGHTRTASIEAPHLATTGAFAYVRNPIYAGSIVLGVGMSCLIGDPLALILTTATFVVLYFGIIPAEEKFLRSQFGAAYDEYCCAVPRLIPGLRAPKGNSNAVIIWRRAKGELLIAALVTGIYAVLLCGHG